MDIHEHQAKELLRQYDIPTPSGYVAFTTDEAIKAAKILNENNIYPSILDLRSISPLDKNAILETNINVQVPLFVNENEIIKVDTRDMSYVGRAKP